jgi:hypothetical protein
MYGVKMMIKSAQKTLAITMLISLAACHLPEQGSSEADDAAQEQGQEQMQAPDTSDAPVVLTEFDGQLSSIITDSNLNTHPQRDLLSP